MLRRIFVALFLFSLSIAAFAQAKRPFTFEAMMQLKRIGEPVVSPDGKWVAFSAVDVSLEANTRTPHLWIVPVAGGEAKRLTPATGSGEDRPRFSPDGNNLIFESSKDGSSQIWLQSFDSSQRDGYRRRPQDHQHLYRSLGRHLVSRRQEHPVCL